MTRILVFTGLALVLTLSLVAVACAPKAAPTGDVVPKADLTKAQSDLTAANAKAAAAEKKAKDLEAQLAAGQKPAKVYRMEPGSHIGVGTVWDFMAYMSDWLNNNTQGRIQCTPTLPGAICPVEEQIEAAAAGTTLAMLPTPSYYPGKIPLAALYNTSIGLPSDRDMQACYELFQDGAAQKLYFDEVEKRYNVKCVATNYRELDALWSSTVNIPHVADLKGVKFRCGDEHFAVPLTSFGASTVWFPGTEIYTGLATGVVDAFTYNGPYDHYSLGAQEVTKYWLKTPIMAAANEQFVVNRDAWNEMGDELHNMIYEAIAAAMQRSGYEALYQIDKAWQIVIAAGIIPVYWNDDDLQKWVAAQMDWAKKYTDQYPECAQFMKIIADYREFKGF